MTDTKEAIKELASRDDVNTEQFQKIISALRGPDYIVQEPGQRFHANLHELKMLTTARIRAIISPRYYGDINHDPLTIMEMRVRDVLLEYTPDHFRSHYKEAVKAIQQVFKYDLKTEKPYVEVKKEEKSEDVWKTIGPIRPALIQQVLSS